MSKALDLKETWQLLMSVSRLVLVSHVGPDGDTLGSTLYLAGREAKNGELLHDATSCSMCRRLIINAGIDRVVIRNTDKDYSVVHVEDWIREDDSLPQQV